MMENNLRPLNEKELQGILETILPLLAALNVEGYCLGEVETKDGKLTHVFSSIEEVKKANTSPTPVLPLSEALELIQSENFQKTAFSKIGDMIVRLLISVKGLQEDVSKKMEEELEAKDALIN